MDFLLIEFILWIIVIIFLFVYFGLFLIKGLKDESKSSRYFFIGVSIFFICTGIQRILSLIYDFFYAEMSLLFIITLLNIVGIIPLLFHLESSVVKSKRIISILSVILVIVYIIANFFFGNDRIIMYYFFIPPFLLAVESVGAIYIYLVLKSSGQVRKNALYIIIGLANFLFFWLLHSQMGRASPSPDPNIMDLIGIISPIGLLVGLFFLALGFFKKTS